MKLNDKGYAITESLNLACKIWALANAWEALLIRDPGYRNPMQVLAGMNVHRESGGNKILIRYMYKQNASVCHMQTFYNKIKSGRN